jgi:hypothetical protein
MVSTKINQIWAGDLERKEEVKSELNVKHLQGELWQTMRMLRAKRLKPQEANSIATQAREICRIAKLQLEYYRLTGKKMDSTNTLLEEK